MDLLNGLKIVGGKLSKTLFFAFIFLFLVAHALPTISPLTKCPSRSPSSCPHATTLPTILPTIVRPPSPSPTSKSTPTNVPSLVYRSSTPTLSTKTNLPSKSFLNPSRAPSRIFPPTVSPTSFRPTTVPSKAPSMIATSNPLKSFVPSLSPATFNRSKIDYDLASNVSNQFNRSFVSNANLFPTTHNVSYFNGSVMSGTIHLYQIYIGNFDTATKNILQTFAANIGSSGWYSILSYSYYGIKNHKRYQASNNTKFMNSVSYLPTQSSGVLTDDIIMQGVYLLTGNASGDPNGLYTVFFNGGFTVAGWNTPGPNNWCGYHLTVNGIRINVIGNPASFNIPKINTGCIPSQFNNYGESPNGNKGADSMLSTYAHEIAETVTDFDGNGWHAEGDSDIEIADFCNRQFGNQYYNLQIKGKKYLIQSLWQPGFGCVMSPQTFMPTVSPSVPSGNMAMNPPSNFPTSQPTTYSATLTPSAVISSVPVSAPSLIPSKYPSNEPTAIPMLFPTSFRPTLVPTFAPTVSPTQMLSSAPSLFHSSQPSIVPTSNVPSFSPFMPTSGPSTFPTALPTVLTFFPSLRPSVAPTLLPSTQPSSARPTCSPTLHPTVQYPTAQPTANPPSLSPSWAPTVSTPSGSPSLSPTSRLPTAIPSCCPSISPSMSPSLTAFPTVEPSTNPSATAAPSFISSVSPTTPVPSLESSTAPSLLPVTLSPSFISSNSPTSALPTLEPSTSPSLLPSTFIPSYMPSYYPTSMLPTLEPSTNPSLLPLTFIPSLISSLSPTSCSPTMVPSTSNPSLPTSISSTPVTLITIYQTSISPSIQPSTPTAESPPTTSSFLPPQFETLSPTVESSFTFVNNQNLLTPSSFPSLQSAFYSPAAQLSNAPSSVPTSAAFIQQTYQPLLLPSSTEPPLPAIGAEPSCATVISPSVPPLTTMDASSPTGTPVTTAPSLLPFVNPTQSPSVEGINSQQPITYRTNPSAESSFHPSVTTTTVPTSVYCPTGQYIPPSSYVCIDCPKGTYNPTAGFNATCITCPSGSISAAGSSQCTIAFPSAGVDFQIRTASGICLGAWGCSNPPPGSSQSLSEISCSADAYPYSVFRWNGDSIFQSGSITKERSEGSLICLYGSYCIRDSDCIPGSYCGNRQVGYSQCLPNPPTNTSCIPPYGACQGSCCSGYSCTTVNAFYSQCTPNSYECIYPSQYPANAIAASFSQENTNNLFGCNGCVDFGGPSGSNLYVRSPCLRNRYEQLAFVNNTNGLWSWVSRQYPSYCGTLSGGTITLSPISAACAQWQVVYYCAAGQYSSATNRGCSSCPANTYNPSAGFSTTCLTCPPGSTSVDGTSQCTITYPSVGVDFKIRSNTGSCLGGWGCSNPPIGWSQSLSVVSCDYDYSALNVFRFNGETIFQSSSLKYPYNPQVARNRICLYGGYCLVDSDCVPGSYCGNKQIGYSQCLPSPKNGSCASAYESCGGALNKTCCSGSSCYAVNSYYSQCQPDSHCSNPNSYPTGLSSACNGCIDFRGSSGNNLEISSPCQYNASQQVAFVNNTNGLWSWVSKQFPYSCATFSQGGITLAPLSAQCPQWQVVYYCNAGQFSSASSLGCQSCPSGSYNPAAGFNTTCLSCPPGYTSSFGASQCKLIVYN